MNTIPRTRSHTDANANRQQRGDILRRSPLAFFALVYGLSVPLWLAGAVVERMMPPDRPVNLPVSAIMAVNPLIAAAILVYRDQGKDGIKALLKRAFDFRRARNRAWFLPVVFLLPLFMVAQYGWMKRTGMAVPNPEITLLPALGLFAAFLISGLVEEIGWQGCAFEPLEARTNALTAGLVLGVVASAWHIVPNLQVAHPAGWLVWQFVMSVGLRILTAWIYNNTGRSVFAAALFHAMYNVSAFLYPVYGSHYDPFLTAILVWGTVGVVIAIWGPKTLAREWE